MSAIQNMLRQKLLLHPAARGDYRGLPSPKQGGFGHDHFRSVHSRPETPVIDISEARWAVEYLSLMIEARPRLAGRHGADAVARELASLTQTPRPGHGSAACGVTFCSWVSPEPQIPLTPPLHGWHPEACEGRATHARKPQGVPPICSSRRDCFTREAGSGRRSALAAWRQLAMRFLSRRSRRSRFDPDRPRGRYRNRPSVAARRERRNGAIA